MPSKDPLYHIEQILSRIEAIETFTARLTPDSFGADLRTLYASLYALQGISEAVRQLPAELLARHPQIPWRSIKGAGNIYRHHHDTIDPNVVWETIRRGLPQLKSAVEKERARLRDRGLIALARRASLDHYI